MIKFWTSYVVRSVEEINSDPEVNVAMLHQSWTEVQDEMQSVVNFDLVSDVS